jgi:Flp pilus assembly secretin CpaC
MNARHAAAAALAASAAAFAAAQAPADSPAILLPNGDMHDTPRYALTPESVASASVSGGADAGAVNSIVAALNAEPSLRGSKITVQPDNGTITLTGATRTPEQKARAVEIATQVAGEGNVVSAILDSRT